MSTPASRRTCATRARTISSAVRSRATTRPECILSERAARALASVQAALAAKQLSLLIWDCYRPARAVADFWRWSQDVTDNRMRAEFYPRIDKCEAVRARLHRAPLGPFARQHRGPRHRAGRRRDTATSIRAAPPRPCFAPAGERADEGAVDLGTSYDCMDERAATDNPEIGKDCAREP